MTKFYVTSGGSHFSTAKPVYYGPFESHEAAEQLLKAHGWVRGAYLPSGLPSYAKYGYSLKPVVGGYEADEIRISHGLYATAQLCGDCEMKTPTQLIAERLYPEESSLKRIIEDWSKSISETMKAGRLREAKEEKGHLGVLAVMREIDQSESIVRQLRYCLEQCPKAPV